MNKDKQQALDMALSVVSKTCALSADKGASLMKLAISKNKEGFASLCKDLNETFSTTQKDSAEKLVEALTAIRTLCETDENAKQYVTDHVEALIKTQATLDYANGVPKVKFQERLEGREQSAWCAIL